MAETELPDQWTNRVIAVTSAFEETFSPQWLCGVLNTKNDEEWQKADEDARLKRAEETWEHTKAHLVLLGATKNEGLRKRLFGTIPDKLLHREGGMAVGVMGAAVGVVSSGGARLNLNETKTLGIEVRNLDGEAPGLYFGFDLEW